MTFNKVEIKAKVLNKLQQYITMKQVTIVVHPPQINGNYDV